MGPCRKRIHSPFVSILIAVPIGFVGCTRSDPITQRFADVAVEKNAAIEKEKDRVAPERDLPALQGKWELVSLKRDWVETKTPCNYVFDGETMTVYPKDKRPSFYTLKLNASKTPSEMDIIATWEDGKVTKAEALYQLDGDTFRWCHVGGKRPGVFLDENNRAGTLNVIRRVRDR